MKAMNLICSYGVIRKQTLYDVWTGEHECGAVYTKGGYVWAYKEGTSKPRLIKHLTNTKLTHLQARRAWRKHLQELEWKDVPEVIKAAMLYN